MEQQVGAKIGGRVEAYAAWVRRSPEGAKMVEEVLQYAGFIFPTWFWDRDMAIEAGYAAASLAALGHDRIRDRGAAAENGWEDTARVSLTALACAQVVAEKLGAMAGQRCRKRLIVTIELIKCVCRLSILYRTRRILIAGGGYSPRRSPSRFLTPGSGLQEMDDCPGRPTYTGRRTGLRLPLPRGHVDGNAASQSAPHVNRSSSSGSSGSMNKWQLLGEILHIVRPLVYAETHLCVGEDIWLPWLLSLAMDVASRACSVRAGGGRVGDLLTMSRRFETSLRPAEAHELRRRKLTWLLYMLRSPVFKLFCKPGAESIAGAFDGIPLAGGIASWALQALLYVQRHHFYICGS